MEDLLQLDACRPLTPAYLPQGFQDMDTPLNWREWDHCLALHPDQRFRTYIVNGIRDRFRVRFDYSRSCRGSSRNMSSALEKPQVITEYLANECAVGHVLGPFSREEFPQIHTSRFGVIPKGSTGKWRLIVDMSLPEGASVNDAIQESLCSLTYVGTKDAAREIVPWGNGALMAKVDIKSAYRNIPVHPDDRWLMGMLWDKALFVDTALPFGLRSAPKIFSAIADAAEWIVKSKGVGFVIHYLDDFLLIGAPASLECREALEVVLNIFNRLGLPVAMDKLEGPACCLTFLGFELDSRAMEIRLPSQKLVSFRACAIPGSGGSQPQSGSWSL